MRNFLILAGFLLSLQILAQTAPTLYSWETQQAKVLPNGDLEWAPLPFQFQKGSSVRYIDFDNGNDANDGLSASTPWKHHPWDVTATGNAKNSSGIQTFIFKRGVVYRGVLTAKESGAAGNQVRLTSNPDWGTGEAAIYGSVIASGGWTKANATIAPKIPNPDLVWYKDIAGIDNPTKVVGEVTSSGIKRVRLARSPNYVNTPLEPLQKWWSFTAKAKSGSVLTLTDTKNFGWTDVNALKGGDVWAIEDAIVMCTLWKQKISDYNPTTKTITVSDQNFGGKDCKYYVENTPYMLDVPGEYYYDKSIGRVFIRLEGDKDPNTTTIEIASKSNLVTISGKSYIEISGLTMGFTTYDNVRYGTTDGVPAIKLDNSSNIVIKNCKFHYLNGGILANGTGKNLAFTDNEMNFMDDFSILLNGPDEVSILRNKIFENGTRHLGRWYSSIPAIAGNLTVGEIAGNIIEHTWGNGLNFFWGKADGASTTVPFVRGLVHHNKVSHSLQGVNDYGGIESWQGGPVFTYNNISEDAQGWHYNWGTQVVSLGYPFYFDGAFKQYAFNNIVKGTGWNKNADAYFQTYGYYNMFVHNVAYNTASLTGSGDNGGGPDGQNYYLANVSDSTQYQINHTTDVAGIPFESIGNNFFSASIFQGTFVTNSPNAKFKFTFNQFVDKLNSFTPDLGQVGFEASRRVFARSKSGDFRPTASSELIDKGVKFFVPFPLSSVVGEWNFCKHKADSSLIKGENFYFTSELVKREEYNSFPKNHLKAFGLAAGSFVKGTLEDFTEGALIFDGQQTYCSLKNDVTSKTIGNNVDMTTNSFVLEAYFKTVAGHTDGVLISKSGTTGYGYQLDVNTSGNARFSILNNGNVAFSQSGSSMINDGNWHHVLVEVIRATSSVKINDDGLLTNGNITGTMPLSGISLTNTADFLIGKNANGNFFAGTLDFVRISKGTLADAKTTIEELYKWEFNGPFLRDMTGNLPIGKRDAGALEKGTKLCSMTVSANPLIFGLGGGAKSFTIEAEKGFEVVKKIGTFYTTTTTGNTINVTVPALASGTRSGDIYIYGCNETQKVKIIQQNITAIILQKQNDIKVMPNPVSGQHLTISVPEDLKTSRAIFMDMNGKVIAKNLLVSGANLMNIKFPRGMYLLNISGQEVNYTTKIVVN
ncbi:MAG TPA: hypothetical protein DCR40_19120 [Prolixibacteraceae bacterium]|nr:hypothetical protein [Prolixibacteraceae bacterium]